MSNNKKPLRIVSAKEMNPGTAFILNFRFYAFLTKLSSELHLAFTDVADKADRILRDAEIDQEDY